MECRKTKKKALASELLKDAEKVLKFVERTDVKELSEWLLKDKHLPLICIGSGGKRTSYTSMLYEIAANVSRNVTPLEFASMAPEVIKKSKILLLSSSGKNMDIKYAAKRALKYNKENTAFLTFNDSDKNAIMKMMAGHNCFLFKNSFKDDFISIRGKFLLFGLIYKAFSGNSHFSDRLCYEGQYKYMINKSGALASIQLLIDALAFIFDFAENYHSINPNDPSNYSGIDKRKPISQVTYVSELDTLGEMTI